MYVPALLERLPEHSESMCVFCHVYVLLNIRLLNHVCARTSRARARSLSHFLFICFVPRFSSYLLTRYQKNKLKEASF